MSFERQAKKTVKQLAKEFMKPKKKRKKSIAKKHRKDSDPRFMKQI